MTNCFRINDKIMFDSGCDCTHSCTKTERSWDDISGWINMQSNDESKKRLALKFGLIIG